MGGGVPKGTKRYLEDASEGVFLLFVCRVLPHCFPLGEPVARSAQQGHGGKGKGKKGKGQGQTNVREFSGKCNKCGQWGHKAADCPGVFDCFVACHLPGLSRAGSRTNPRPPAGSAARGGEQTRAAMEQMQAANRSPSAINCGSASLTLPSMTPQ